MKKEMQKVPKLSVRARTYLDTAWGPRRDYVGDSTSIRDAFYSAGFQPPLWAEAFQADFAGYFHTVDGEEIEIGVVHADPSHLSPLGINWDLDGVNTWFYINDSHPDYRYLQNYEGEFVADCLACWTASSFWMHVEQTAFLASASDDGSFVRKFAIDPFSRALDDEVLNLARCNARVVDEVSDHISQVILCNDMLTWIGPGNKLVVYAKRGLALHNAV